MPSIASSYLVGRKFGRLTVVSFARIAAKKQRVWNCVCDCGQQTTAWTQQLTGDRKTSCGCVSWSNFVDMTGHRSGRLVVVSRDLNPSNTKVKWFCKCDCGGEITVLAHSLRSGKAVSCGCISRENGRKQHFKHGMARTPMHKLWDGMIARCHRPSCWKAYPYYGGRGIIVCQRWRERFEAFLEDMGERPHPSLTLEPINNDGNYEPGNVRWATRKEQMANRRPPQKRKAA